MLDIDNIAYSIGQISIIDDISFNAGKDEFVSIIGPSGCGKSTLLRIIAGLIKPSRGSIRYNGEEVTGPNSEISFVFQDFGLLPWLTNIENVKVGLSLLDISEEEKDKRAASIFKSMGLEGFENAYPNMLSGGMKQRVGIARAIISNPRVLLMDEPFSSLDELTANALRGDVIYMLKSRDVSVESVIMVTHNVEEAVEMSEKIVVLSNKPSKVKKVIGINARYPRNRHTDEFERNVDSVYEWLTK